MEGHVLIIAEKEKQAEQIAGILSNGRYERKKMGRVPYYVFKRDGARVTVVPARGHIYQLKTRDKGYPTFNVEWAPTRGVKGVKSYIKTIRELYRGGRIVLATDYDMEGEVIGGNIIEFTLGIRDIDSIDRMIFSSLTKKEITEAWENPAKVDVKLLEAGRARHEMDFMWGVTFSRALMEAVRIAGGFRRHPLSVGRVQTPMLAAVVELERKIQNFKPEPYWELTAKVLINGKWYVAQYVGNPIKNCEEAVNLLEKARGGKAIVKDVRISKSIRKPPVPFDTTELQKEASRWFGLSPQQTINQAEGIYLEGAISYIRTDSQVYPKDLDHRGLLTKLSEISQEYRDFAEDILSKAKLTPSAGKKGGKESAHPAIHPTGKRPKRLNRRQWKLYDLICRRYFATLGDNMVRETKRITIDINGLTFKLSGTRTVEIGWGKYYKPYLDLEEVDFGPVKAGDELRFNVDLVKKMTKPPPRMTPMKLVLWAEKNGIGTKATRGEMIKKLLDRRYLEIEKKALKPTKLGFCVAEVIEERIPILLSVEMTRRFEEQLFLVKNGKITREELLENVKEEILKLTEEFNEHIERIGKDLHKKLSETLENTIGTCPKCGKPLKLIRRSDGKRFIWCTTLNCTYYPLPQKGKLTIINRKCMKCGLKPIKVSQRGKRPWELCVACGICFKCELFKKCRQQS
ncbi:MAG: DNA topoisomerase I [Thermoproteota archaeon]|nr:MAG: DNA topoisomerase I [Candidatus Korarchaeota archaeon]